MSSNIIELINNAFPEPGVVDYNLLQRVLSEIIESLRIFQVNINNVIRPGVDRFSTGVRDALRTILIRTPLMEILEELRQKLSEYTQSNPHDTLIRPILMQYDRINNGFERNKEQINEILNEIARRERAARNAERIAREAAEAARVIALEEERVRAAIAAAARAPPARVDNRLRLRRTEDERVVPEEDDPGYQAYLENLGRRMRCPVCGFNERDTTLNCEHTLCAECASHPSLTTCPICRAPITNKKAFYLEKKYLKYKNKYLALKRDI